MGAGIISIMSRLGSVVDNPGRRPVHVGETSIKIGGLEPERQGFRQSPTIEL